MKAPLSALARITTAQVVRLALAVNLMLGSTVMLAGAAEPSAPIRLVAFGDSLTAGFNLEPSQSFPAQLADALKAKGVAVEITNAGVSGDTSADGLERFDWAIGEGTEAVILELGANDALQGRSPEKARANIEKIIEKLRARNIEVLLAGMVAPKNWGPEYSNKFNAIFPELADKHGLIYYPFFLEGVAMQTGLNLSDGMHPNARGVRVIVDRIMPAVEQLLGRVEARRLAASKI